MTPSAKEGSYQSQSLPGRNPKTVTLQAIALLENQAPDSRWINLGLLLIGLQSFMRCPWADPWGWPGHGAPIVLMAGKGVNPDYARQVILRHRDTALSRG